MLSNGSPLCLLEILSHGFQAARPFLQNEHIVFFFSLVFNRKKKINASSQIAADTQPNSTNSPHCNRPGGHSCQMEVAAPKGRAGLVLPGVLTVVNRPVPSHLPKFISRPRLHCGSDGPNLPHLSESLLLLERHCSCRDQCGSVGCLFVSYQSASGTTLCVRVCARARMCVFVLLCSSVMLRFCFFSLWVRVNLPVYPGLKVTHSHFGTPRASTVQLCSQTDPRTSSKKYQHNLFVSCSVCGCV